MRGRTRAGSRQQWHHMAAVALLGVFSLALQWSTATLGSVDGYFHARYAALLWRAGGRDFPPPFPWLPLTIRSADRYYDHHMLFHLLLAPFTAGDVVWGAKVASAVFGGMAFLAVYAALVRHGVTRAGWWLVAMFAMAPDFLYRMQMPRVQALSLVVLILALEVAFSRRFRWLLPLAMVYTWLYDAFPLMLLLTGSAAAAIAITERRVEWRALAYPLLGIALGLMVNPYFPKDIWFIAHHYLGKVEIGDAMHVGSEWYPYPLAQWLGWGGAGAVLTTAGSVAWRARRQLDVPRVTLLLVGAVFFVLVWHSRRFIEYAAPFVLLALAATLHEWVDQHLAQWTANGRRALAVGLLIGGAISGSFAAAQLRNRPAPTRYAGGAAFLGSHTLPGAIVFTPNWDDFPLLFFHNQYNRYVIGLDPAYLAQQDPALYHLWRQLGEGGVTPPSRFLDRFDSQIVLSDHTHQRFLAALAADGAMERVYEDEDCVIFRRRG